MNRNKISLAFRDAEKYFPISYMEKSKRYHFIYVIHENSTYGDVLYECVKQKQNIANEERAPGYETVFIEKCIEEELIIDPMEMALQKKCDGLLVLTEKPELMQIKKENGIRTVLIPDDNVFERTVSELIHQFECSGKTVFYLFDPEEYKP